MSNPTLTLAIDLVTKQATITGTVGIRETVDVVLTGTGGYGATDLRMWITVQDSAGDWTLLASLNAFADQTTYFDGELSLNTEEIIAEFDNAGSLSMRAFAMVIHDITNNSTLVNSILTVQNVPFTTGMDDPTVVDPIAGVAYAPLANGVTNGDSHNHLGGDGATIAHSSLSEKGTKTHAEIDAVIAGTGKMEGVVLLDTGDSNYYKLNLVNGVLTVGVQVA